MGVSSSQKKTPHSGMEGEPRNAGSSPCAEEPGFLFTAPALPPSPPSSHPLPSKQGKGQILPFLGLESTRLWVEGAVAARRSPNRDQLPLPLPVFLPRLWRKAGNRQNKRTGNVQIAQSVAQPRQLSTVFNFPAPPCLSFPTPRRRISFAPGAG